MEGVTDVVFRQVVTGLPRPDVLFTEFTNADGLCSLGKKATLPRLQFTPEQHLIVAQIWGTHPGTIEESARLCQELGFDGVDINMGCPDRAVMKSGAGSALINNPPLAKEIIAAAKAGASNIPVSVKTRIGVNTVTTESWISFLLNQNIAALTVHGRTAKQLSDVPANWEEIGKAVQMRNEIAPHTFLIGNGDVMSFSQAVEKHDTYHVDGIMIGRGIFSNPWVFEKSLTEKIRSKEEFISLLKTHVQLFEQTWGDTKNFDIMKKFFKMYVNSFDGAKELRIKLMECKNGEDVKTVLANNP